MAQPNIYVATILLNDGTSLNQRLLIHGLAWWYRHFSQDPVLKVLENHARYNHLGLWSNSTSKPIPPWIWRRTHKRK